MTRVACVLVVALVGAGVAVAAPGDPQSRPNARDQATARRAVVQLSDFAAGSGWSGGSTKLSGSGTSKCRLAADQSDLVETAEAASSFKFRVPIVAVVSQATLYGSERMARLSWERAQPGLLAFLRCVASSTLPANARLVSVRPLDLPRVGSFGGAYRTTFDVGSGGGTLRMVTDVAVFGTGRALLVLMQLSPYASAAAARDAEVRLANAMVLRAGGPVA